MANYFNLILDTLAPKLSSFTINNGSSITTTTNVALQINCSDASTTGYSMKIWGISGATSESSASWETFATSKSVTLPDTTDGNYTISIKVRDDVYNESEAYTATIQLSTALPQITVSAPSASKISLVDGKNYVDFTFTSDVNLKAYKVKLFTDGTINGGQDAGTQIPSTGGSTNMTGTTVNANKAVTCRLYGADLSTACGGVDAQYVIKIFGQGAENNLWSA